MQPQDKMIRPTKKQQETLVFIEKFIIEHGYSPSYREIMQGCNYTSVATVALHVNNLIKRGHLQKRDKSARSLEVVKAAEKPSLQSSNVSEKEEKWLVKKVDYFFSQCEQSGNIEPGELDQLYVLLGALKVLRLDGAAQSFMPRLSELKKRVK